MLFAILSVACAATSGAELPAEITIVGAQALPAETYLDALHLPADANLDAATAKEIRDQLQDFLTRNGFELATVTTEVQPNRIVVQLDEGQIDRIVFVGPLTYELLRFKLELQSTNQVFNRQQLDRQVAELSDELGISGIEWDLVRTPDVPHEGPQVTELPRGIVRPRRPYEVRVRFPEQTGSDVGLDLRAYYIDGLEVGLHHVGRDLLGAGDQWDTAVSVGVGVREQLGTGTWTPYFSRAAVNGSYATARFAKYFRPMLWAEASLVSRHRPGLNIERYQAFTANTGAQLELSSRRGLRIAVGGGYEYRLLFDVASPLDLDSPFTNEVIENARPFVRVVQESVIDPNVLRWDRRHALEGELRYCFGIDRRGDLGWADLRYQFVKELGWHDLWIKGRAHTTWGRVTFHDEISVGEFLRGLDVDDWVRAGASLLIEFRYSLIRDLFKLGVFHDLAVLGTPGAAANESLEAELANSLGPSAHFLIADLFQLDTYLGFGFRQHHDPNVTFSLVLNKAF